MTKVHPNACFPARDCAGVTCCRGQADGASSDGGRGSISDAAVLTVWRRSLVLSCSGFTVFDAKGNLVFRVDHYGSSSPAELVLMDAAGKPLLTLRRKRLSLGDTWQIYDGEDAVGPLFAVKRRHHVSLRQRQSKELAHVIPCRGGAGYEVEGSYGRRSCCVYDERLRLVAEVRRKESAVGGVDFGGEVFRLVVHALDLDARLAMALVIVLDQMFGSRA